MQPTSTKVVSTPRPVIVPPWIPIALGDVGVLEDTRPSRSNLRIEGYHALTAAGRAVDDVAWCASYVGWALINAGLPSTRSKTAASYKTYGTKCGWVFGAVIFFPDTDPDSVSSGHVAFLLGLRGADDCFVLGGNQSNAVTIAPRKRKGAELRWPLNVELGTDLELAA